jgi:hypothetical protein
VAFAVAVLLAGASSSVGAADWSLDPRVTLNGVWDDNRRLTPIHGQEIEVWGAEIVAELGINAETPRSSFYMTPRVRSTFYPDESALETTNGFFDMGYEGRGQRSKAGFDAFYSRQETVGNFFPDAQGGGGLGNPDPGEDIGNSPVTNVERRFRFRPTAEFELTQRVVLDVDLGYLDVAYDQQEANERQDFTSGFLRGALGYRVTPQQTLSIRLEGGRYEPKDGENQDSQVLELEWANQLSEISRLYFRGGSSRVQTTDDLGQQKWETGFSGGAGVQWHFEVTDLFLDATHMLDPSPSGRVEERDQVRLRLERQLSQVTTVFFGVRGIQDNRPQVGNLQDRKYWTAEAQFNWRFKRDWSLGGGYEYVWRDEENDPNPAEANRLHLGVTYHPQLR